MAAASSSKAAASSGSKRKAGTSSSNGSGKTKKTKSSSTAAEDATIPLGKALASTSKATRDAAVRSLTSYLSANGAHTIPALELRKLWKGLFYCFWMSDKPLVQQRLADDLSSLVLVHPTNAPEERVSAGLGFLEAFWDTMVQEWAGLDKHRVDKFYLLVRRFVAAGFRLLAEERWPAAGVSEFQRILGKFDGGVLSTNDPKVPDSLTYHLCDLYLDELEKVMQSLHEEVEEGGAEEDEDAELPLVPTLELLVPFVDALATAKSKAMYERIWAGVLGPLLDDTLVASARDDGFSEEDDEDDEDEKDEADEEEEEVAGDATTATQATEFHSFADESTLTHDQDESEPSLPPSSPASSTADDDGEDVRYPLLLALSAVPTPTDVDEMEEDAEVDVALVLRKAIFQALFTAASRKDATEARRRLLYQLWRDEQDRLNDAQESSESDEESDDE